MASRPLRTIGFAVKEGRDLPAPLGTWDPVSGSGPAPAVLGDPAGFAALESGLTFVGLTGIKDPARPEVANRGSLDDDPLALLQL